MSTNRARPAKGRKGAADMKEPLLTLRAAFILMAAMIASAVTGVLTYRASASWAEAYLAAGSACAAAITLLNAIVG